MSSWRDLPRHYRTGAAVSSVPLFNSALTSGPTPISPVTYRYHLLEDAGGEEAKAPLITHARHRSHLESALGFLDAFLETRGAFCGFLLTHLACLMPYPTDGCPRSGVEDIVLGAEELRYAAQAVGKISGLVDVEDVLDVIFSQFCIGK